MRQHRSVWMLLSRSTFRWVLVIILALAVAQGGLFLWAMDRAWDDAEEALQYYVKDGWDDWMAETEGSWDGAIGPEDFIRSLETVWSSGRMAIPFGVAAVVTAAVLMAFGSEGNVKVSYTFRRLSVSEKSVFVWQALYNTLCFFLLWAAEILIALALCRWYTAQVVSGYVNRQTVFLAFARNEFLRELLPLADTARWVRNGVLCLTLGTVAAWDTYAQRRSGKIHAAIVCALGVAAVAFLNSDVGITVPILVGSAGVFMILIALFNVFSREEEVK